MATGTYSDGTTADLSATVVWSSSVPAVAVNPAAGVTTAAAVGATVITAVSGTVSKTTNLTVSAPVLTSIAVTPASVSVVLGANQQYVATGTYSNGSTADLSSQVTWTATSVTGSATVLTNGLAKGTAVGTVSITAAKLGFPIPAVSLTVIP